MSDQVNSPYHYNQGDIECIDAIRAMLGRDGFIAYCHGNAMKYLWRHQYKGKAVQDLQKAEWYQDRIKQEIMDEDERVSTASDEDMPGGKPNKYGVRLARGDRGGGRSDKEAYVPRSWVRPPEAD